MKYILKQLNNKIRIGTIAILFLSVVACNKENSLNEQTPLTSNQLLPFLPELVNNYIKTFEYAYSANEQLVTGGYGPNESSYDFSIGDGAGLSSINENFFISYEQMNQGPVGTEYVYIERDGYKTIAFLQPNINRNQISFIYNNRFKITLEGPDGADALWSYIDFENLRQLDQFN